MQIPVAPNPAPAPANNPTAPTPAPGTAPAPSTGPVGAAPITPRMIPFDKLREDAKLQMLGLDPTTDRIIGGGRVQFGFSVTKEDGTELQVPAGSTVALTCPKGDRALYAGQVSIISPDGKTVERITPKKYDTLIDNARTVNLPGPGKEDQVLTFDRGGIAITRERHNGRMFDLAKLKETLATANLEELAKDPSKITSEFQKGIVEALGLSIDPEKVQVKSFIKSNLGYAGIRLSLNGKTQDIRIPTDLAQGVNLSTAQNTRLEDILKPLLDPSKIPNLDPNIIIDAFNRTPASGKAEILAKFGTKMTDEHVGLLSQRLKDINDGLSSSQLEALRTQNGLSDTLSTEQVREFLLDRNVRQLNAFVDTARNADGENSIHSLEEQVEAMLSGNLELEGRALPVLKALTADSVPEKLQGELINRLKHSLKPEEYLSVDGKIGIVDQVLLDIHSTALPDTEIPKVFAALQAVAPDGVPVPTEAELSSRLTAVRQGSLLSKLEDPTLSPEKKTENWQSLLKAKEAVIGEILSEADSAPGLLAQGGKSDRALKLMQSYLIRPIEEKFRTAFAADLATIDPSAQVLLYPALLDSIKATAVARGDAPEKIALIDEMAPYAKAIHEQIKILGAGLSEEKIQALLKTSTGEETDLKVLKSFLYFASNEFKRSQRAPSNP